MTVVVEKPQGGKVTWTLSIEEAQAIEVLLGAIKIGASKEILDGRNGETLSPAYYQLMRALEENGLRIDRELGRWLLVLDREPAAPEFELSDAQLLAIRAIFGASNPAGLARRLSGISRDDLAAADIAISNEVDRRDLPYTPQRGNLAV